MARGSLYKAVVQMVLLYGSESWVIMGEMIKALEAFHNRIARKLTGNMDRSVRDEGW